MHNVAAKSLMVVAASKIRGAVKSSKLGKIKETLTKESETTSNMTKPESMIGITHHDYPGSAASFTRLKTELSLKEKGVISVDGKLTKKSMSESQEIIPGEKIINNKVTKAFEKDSPWAKYNKRVEVPEGDPISGAGSGIEIHFYGKKDSSGKIKKVLTQHDFKITKDIPWEEPIHQKEKSNKSSSYKPKNWKSLVRKSHKEDS